MATYVNGISQATTASTNSASKSANSSATNSVMGKEQFLTLLVAQLQNQDPLNPSDPTEFTAQLAQFGQLEQMINLNTSMESLITAQANMQNLSTFSLIGKEVQVEGSTLQLKEEGATAEIGYTLDNTASALSIQIKNSSGHTVRTLNATALDAGTHTMTWDGLDDEGNAVAAGKYTLVLQAKSGSEGTSVAVTPLVRTEVTGVDLSGTVTKLDTPIGQFSLTTVHGVFEKKQTSEDATTTTESGEDTSTTASSSTDIATTTTET